MLKVRVLLRPAQTLAALSLGLIRVKVVRLLCLPPALLAVLLYPLSLALLVGCGGCLGLGLGFRSLLRLFALYLRVLRCVPRVQDLLYPSVCVSTYSFMLYVHVSFCRVEG